MIFERLYGTAGTVAFPLIAFSSTSFHTSVTSSMFASGDVKISIDYGGFTNTATLPTADASNKMAILSLTATELTGKHIQIYVVDQTASKVWEDQAVLIETYGNASAQHAFNRHAATVQASLTANQTGVTIATVTDITNTVKASLTANQTGVTVATVTDITNTVKASLTANQTGVTVAQIDNLGASAATQVYNQALSAASTALSNASVTANPMNRIMTHLDATVSSRSSHSATDAAGAVWLATQSAYDTAGRFGAYLDATVSGISVGGGSADWTDAERAYIRHALGVPGTTTAGSGGVIHSISSKVTTAPTDAANAILAATVTSSSFNTDTVGQRVTAIDNQLPGSSTLSAFDPSTTTVKASLTAAQTGVTIATVTDVTNTVKASLTAAQTGVTVATVTNVTNAVSINSNSDITAIKAKTDNLPEGIQKNTALSNFEFLMVDSSDHITPKTGLTVTAQRSIDGAAFAACANSVSEVSNGIYKINLAAADLNGDVITFKFTATGADATYITLKTEA